MTTKDQRSLPEYYIWRDVVYRCTNPKFPYYDCYGGRGITVCERWLEFGNFLADMGPRPPHTYLERIGDEHYQPGSCKWVTTSERASIRHARWLARNSKSLTKEIK